jgi:pilus assembly protein CpaE
MKPFERQRLLGAIQIVHSRDLRLRQQLGADENAGTAAGRQNRPRVVAVHGVKGGVGTTTIACNLAAALCDLTDRRVALIDGDLLSSDVGVVCNLPPTRTLADLLPEVHRLDAEVLEGAFLQHPSGVSVLLAPDDLQRAEEIAPDEVKRAVNALRQHFDFQIVDTPSDPVPVTLAVMDEADLIVLVLTPDMAALRNAARFLRLAAQLDYANEKIMLVVNRADAGRQIDLGVIEEQLHRSVAVALPMDGKVPVDCTNAGDLFVVAFPRSRIAQQVASLADAVAEQFGWPAAQGARGAQPGRPASPGAVAVAAGAPAAAGTPAAGPAQMSIVQRLTRWLTPRRREATGSAR